MGFSMTVFFSILSLVSLLSVTSSAQSTFRCTSSGTCHALIDYASPNSTALSVIKDRFGVRNLRTILGANNLPLSTPPTYPVAATQIIKIPIPCLCRNGTGISDRRPTYRVVPDDGLYHIAAEVFSNLVTYQQIQTVNNITDANMIEVGQELWIPLPCSCDEVDGNQVVHYGHLVANGSTVEGIAQEYNTTADTLLSLNGMNSSSQLLAGAVLDVPLKGEFGLFIFKIILTVPKKKKKKKKNERK